MPTLIPKPAAIEAAGNQPKRVEEIVGRVISETPSVSLARMTSPSGWVEPGQTPEFDEFTLVLRGMFRVSSREGSIDVEAGQAVIARRGEWVRNSTPGPEGAECIAVCLPAFSPLTVSGTPERRGPPAPYFGRRRRTGVVCLSAEPARPFT